MDFKDKEGMTIILPIKESDYDIFVSDKVVGRSVIEDFYNLHPELFFPYRNVFRLEFEWKRPCF